MGLDLVQFRWLAAAAVSKAFMSSYIGPVILFLVSLDLAIGRFIHAVGSPSREPTWIVWAIALVSFALLSCGMVWLVMT